MLLFAPGAEAALWAPDPSCCLRRTSRGPCLLDGAIPGAVGSERESISALEFTSVNSGLLLYEFLWWSAFRWLVSSGRSNRSPGLEQSEV